MRRSLVPSLLAALLLAACTKKPQPSPLAAVPTVEKPPAANGAVSVEGEVWDPSGEPVDGAVVALVPALESWQPDKPPAGRVRTSNKGRFRFDAVPPGGYGLTVTAPGHAALFRTDFVVVAGQPLRLLELRLGEGGAVLTGGIKDSRGKPVPNAWVGISRVSDDLGDFAYVQADAQGAYQVKLPEGSYWLQTLAPDTERTPRNVTVAQAPQTVDLTLEAPTLRTPAPPEVAAWIRSAAVPLATVEAGHGFEDLKRLEPALAGARIVALGEATHGTREFFQLKHRMFEHLATRMGFTVFAIEANFSEALAINDYVLTGEGDPAQALAGLYFWTWDTEEVLALIRWMRAYNADPGHPRKLKFYGVDMQFTPAATRAVLAYLAKVDPAYKKQVEPTLSPLLAKDLLGSSQRKDPGAVAPLAEPVRALSARLAQERKAYAARSSEKEWALAARHARILEQFIDANSHGWMQRDEERDRAMAENARWILEHEGRGAKMVLWAHNGHVAKGDGGGSVSMGEHLRKALGDGLYVFGFAFNQGSFQAIYLPASKEDPLRGLIQHTVPPAPPEWLDASLAAAGLPLFALDLRSLPNDGPVATFWSERRLTRETGAVYRQGLPPRPVVPAERYDGLLFVESTTAARANPTGRRGPKPF
jgi:erythromycin esterase